MVSREQARVIAEAAISSDAELTGISQVLSWEEVDSRKPISPFVDVDWQNCWVAYATYRNWAILRSSTVVAVHKMSGAVLYQGSASDEG